jgi:hypothetical protein
MKIKEVRETALAVNTTPHDKSIKRIHFESLEGSNVVPYIPLPRARDEIHGGQGTCRLMVKLESYYHN